VYVCVWPCSHACRGNYASMGGCRLMNILRKAKEIRGPGRWEFSTQKQKSTCKNTKPEYPNAGGARLGGWGSDSTHLPASLTRRLSASGLPACPVPRSRHCTGATGARAPVLRLCAALDSDSGDPSPQNRLTGRGATPPPVAPAAPRCGAQKR
jgi:hypothetical protein